MLKLQRTSSRKECRHHNTKESTQITFYKGSSNQGIEESEQHKEEIIKLIIEKNIQIKKMEE